jgi:hypothetical protein
MYHHLARNSSVGWGFSRLSGAVHFPDEDMKQLPYHFNFFKGMGGREDWGGDPVGVRAASVDMGSRLGISREHEIWREK